MDKTYIVPFVGLKEGKHQFDYVINNEFFETYKYDEILGAAIDVRLDFVKKSTLLELNFSAAGEIEVICDVTSEQYQEPIDTSLSLVVKFGNEFNDDNEEILIIPHSEFQLDVAQFIFEMIVLAVPVKKVHPGIEDGTLQSDILDKLEELKPKETTNNKDTDPRWSKLKDLLTDKKD